MKISFKNIILIDKMEFKLEDFFPLYPESLSNNSKTRFEIGSLDVINTLKELQITV